MWLFDLKPDGHLLFTRDLSIFIGPHAPLRDISKACSRGGATTMVLFLWSLTHHVPPQKGGNQYYILTLGSETRNICSWCDTSCLQGRRSEISIHAKNIPVLCTFVIMEYGGLLQILHSSAARFINAWCQQRRRPSLETASFGGEDDELAAHRHSDQREESVLFPLAHWFNLLSVEKKNLFRNKWIIKTD